MATKRKKYILTVLICLFFTLASVFFCGLRETSAALGATGTPDYAWYGNGTANMFTISTADELAGFANITNGADGKVRNSFGGKVITLSADIDLSVYSNFTPIAFNVKFDGTFNGNGHTVSNVSVNQNSVYVGLFGLTGTSSVIKNLSVSGDLTGTALTGGIVGESGGKIQNCVFSGSVQGNVAGGIAATNQSGIIQNCGNKGSVSGIYSGGIVGVNQPNCKVVNSYNIGTLGGYGGGQNICYVGGITGENRGNMQNCYSAGNITSGNYAGGIIAWHESGAVDYVYWNNEINLYAFSAIDVTKLGATSSNALAMSTAQMTAATFVTSLNDNIATLANSELILWKADTSGANGGYPMFLSDADNAEKPTITAQPQDVTVYIDEPAELTLTAGVSKGDISYQWYEAPSKTNSGGTAVPGEISGVFSAPTAVKGTKYYYCVVTNTDGTVLGNTSSESVSAVATVKVQAGIPGEPVPVDFDDSTFFIKILEILGKEEGEIIFAHEVEDIETLSIQGLGITSLVGIEFFTGLKTLDCTSNMLFTLDLSNNTELTSLRCSTNKLRSLILGDNYALTELYCNSNSLTTLDISHTSVSSPNFQYFYNYFVTGSITGFSGEIIY